MIPQVLGFVPEERPKKTEKFHFPTHCPCPLKTPVQGGGGRRGAALHAAGSNARSSRSSGCATSCRATASTSRGWAARTSRISSTTGCSRSRATSSGCTSKEAEIKKREGWGDLSVRNLLAAIEARKTISLDRFINALGIPLIGEATAKILAQEYGDADTWLAEMLKAAKERKKHARRREEGEGRGRGRPELRPAVQRRADRRHDGRRDVRLLQRGPQRRDHQGPAQAAHRRGGEAPRDRRRTRRSRTRSWSSPASSRP